MLVFELLAFLVVAALALPGIHVAEQEAQAVDLMPDADLASGRAAGRGAGVARAALAGRSGSRGARSRCGWVARGRPAERRGTPGRV